jgi:hypothetical protein
MDQLAKLDYRFATTVQQSSGGVESFSFSTDTNLPLKLASAHIVADYIYCDTGSLNLLDIESGDIHNVSGHTERINGKGLNELFRVTRRVLVVS